MVTNEIGSIPFLMTLLPSQLSGALSITFSVPQISYWCKILKTFTTSLFPVYIFCPLYHYLSFRVIWSQTYLWHFLLMWKRTPVVSGNITQLTDPITKHSDSYFLRRRLLYVTQYFSVCWYRVIITVAKSSTVKSWSDTCFTTHYQNRPSIRFTTTNLFYCSGSQCVLRTPIPLQYLKNL